MAENLRSQEVNEYRLLRLLVENPSINQRAIARDLNISLGAVNYSLRALLDRGLLKVQNFRNSKNKVAYIYLLTPSGITQKGRIAAKFLASRLKEYELIKREIEATREDLLRQTHVRPAEEDERSTS